jgi:hypothetical protein
VTHRPPARAVAFAPPVLAAKQAATTGHQLARLGRGHFAEPVPRTLAYLRRTLQAHPRFGRLRELLAPHVPELG